MHQDVPRCKAGTLPYLLACLKVIEMVKGHDQMSMTNNAHALSATGWDCFWFCSLPCAHSSAGFVQVGWRAHGQPFTTLTQDHDLQTCVFYVNLFGLCPSQPIAVGQCVHGRSEVSMHLL